MKPGLESRVVRPWPGGRRARTVPLMVSVLRAVLLAVLVVLFIATLAAIFSGSTGGLEKLVLVGVAVLVALAVPPVQRLGVRGPH